MKLVFRIHALQRMAQRGISLDDVRQAVTTGQVIEDYPNDTPYPSRLILGWVSGRPLHVVAADNHSAGEIIIVTVYEPDPNRWDAQFTRRRP